LAQSLENDNQIFYFKQINFNLMILKNMLALGLITLISIPSFAQKPNPKHVNWYGEQTLETKQLNIELVDVQGMIEFSKFKLKLKNKTTDYILYKPQESLFRFEFGDLKPADKKTILIQPLDKDSKVIDVKGAGRNLHVDTYKYELNGLYRIPVNVPSTPVPNLNIPISTNEQKAGNFKIEVLKSDQTTQETAVKFKVTYLGEGMGLVEPKLLGVKVISVRGKKHEDDRTYANDVKSSGFLLSPGDSENFIAYFHIEGRIADMQFANMEIVWGDTFKDCKIEKIEGATIELKVDPGLTAGKNK
jgi:hypothetical protein